ncbi:MAG: PaaI family thioesterase [Myxococcota bacterium]
MNVLQRIRDARASGDWAPLVEAVPYLRFLGVCVERTNGELTGRMAYAEHLVGNPTLPALHGGALGALLEAACQFEVLFRAESAVLPKTITLTIDYLRSAKPQDVFVRARIVKQGRRIVTAHATAWQEDETKPVAIATVHLLVMT